MSTEREEASKTLEDLSKEEIVQLFADVDEEITRHHPIIGYFSEICKKICREDGGDSDAFS